MGSGPISDHKVLEGEPPLWCVCQDSQAQVCATWLHEQSSFVAASARLWPPQQRCPEVPSCSGGY